MKVRTQVLSFALVMAMVLTCSIPSVQAAANLVVTAVSGPNKAFLNRTVAVTYKVKNSGDAASGGYEVALYLSRDKAITPATDRLLKKVVFADGLAVGEVRKTTTKVVVPNDFLNGLSGDYYYGAAVGASTRASYAKVAVLRYQDNGDGTVTDFKTHLMWQQADDDKLRAWSEAGTYCNDLVLGEHDDWTLPPVEVLETIVDYARAAPCIDPVFNSRSNYYWSSSTYVYGPALAWGVHFYNGVVDLYGKSYYYYVRCVRSGP